MDYLYPEAEIPWREREKIRHEINTIYSKYEGKSIIVHKSVGLDNCYYNYYVENNGYDDMNIFAKVPNAD